MNPIRIEPHQGELLGDYTEAELDPWLAGQQAALAEGAAFEQALRSTPLSDYGMQAGAMLGVDPYITRGRFTPSKDIGAYDDQRDLETLAAYGMPYKETISAIKAGQQDAEQGYVDQQQATEDAAYEQMAGSFADITGYDLGQLAQTGNFRDVDLYEAAASEEFAVGRELVGQAYDLIGSGNYASAEQAYMSSDPPLCRYSFSKLATMSSK